MPHYKNGEPAKAGDFVQGRGYNMKAEIRGYLLKVTPGATACNVVIGVTEAKHDADTIREAQAEFFPHGPSVEYGQADAFDKVEAPV